MRCVIRRIAPPLPAASRPSKIDHHALALRDDPLLHRDELGLKILQFDLVARLRQHAAEVHTLEEQFWKSFRRRPIVAVQDRDVVL